MQVYAARTVGWRGVMAVHSWIAFKPRGAAEYTRYEVMGWGVDRGAPALRVNRTGPDNYWFGSRPDLLVDRRGDGVDAIIAKVETAVAAYPYPATYRTWPGPNSNTFVAYVARAVPELRLDLPPTAIGKDYLAGAALVGLSPSGTGGQVSVLGLLGCARGLGRGSRDQSARPHLRGRREGPRAQDSHRRPARPALTHARRRFHQIARIATAATPHPPPAAQAARTPSCSATAPMKNAPIGVDPTNTHA